jgi:hypothetical protein
MKDDSSAVRRLCRMYDVLLHAYPRDFRSRYGSEMAQVFRISCRRLSQTRGRAVVLRFALSTAEDWLVSISRERIASMRAGAPDTVRFALLAVLAASAVMMGVRVYAFRRLVGMPGGLTFVIEAAAALLAYGIFVVWVTASDGSPRRAALKAGTMLGAAGAAIQIAHLGLETSIDLGPVWNGVTGFGLLFCTFVLWGVAGYRAARESGSIVPGVIAGCWSAVVTMSLLIAFGFMLEFYLAVPKPEYVATWGEFKRSGWTDVRAFTVVNTLDSAVSHLVIGPIAGAIFGTIAAAFARNPRRRPGPPSGEQGAHIG